MATTRKAQSSLGNASKKSKTAESHAIQVGDELPKVEVTLETGETADLGKHKLLALFAYPKASTPGCTRQTSGFGERYPEFEKLGVAVYGLSADSPRAQTTFKTKTGVDFHLISDPEYELIAPLGAKKSPKGVIRSHWLFVDGKAVLVEHGVKPDESSKKVLEAATKYANGDETKVEAEAEANGKPSVENEPVTESADVKADEVEKPSEAEKPAEDVIEKPAEDVIEKPTEDVIEKPAEDVIEKPAEDVIEKPAEEVIEKPAEEVVEKPAEEIIPVSTELL